METYTARAHEVFSTTVPRDDECPMWHRLYNQMAIADGSSREEMEARYSRALAFDPFDIYLPLGHAYQLLPRWHGSYQELEAFASMTAARTADVYGEAMYARIYAHVSEFDDLRDMAVDIKRLARGYGDWFRQTESQFAVNKLAVACHLFDDHQTLNQIIESGQLHELHLECWPSVEAAAAAFAAVKRRRKKAA